MTIPDRHLRALRIILSALEGRPPDWAVTGSLGMALQGVPVEVHDIDLQTDRQGAYTIERLLSAWAVSPVRYLESERIRSHLGALEIEGVRVEIIGAVSKRLENDGWEEPVDVALHRHWVESAGLQVPVLSLAYECEAYRKLGRPEKAELLRAWLDRQAQGPPGPDAGAA